MNALILIWSPLKYISGAHKITASVHLFARRVYLQRCAPYLGRVSPSVRNPTGDAGTNENVGLRSANPTYKDVPGFCKSATLDDIRKHGHVLTPGRYVGAESQEDDGEPFEEKMKRLTATLRQQQTEAAKLDAAIAANLKELGYGG